DAMVRLNRGDTIVGALGARAALHGYAGSVPASVQAGSRLALLNLGGVIGACDSWHPSVGPPFEVEILGQVVVFPHFRHREGVPADLGFNAICEADEPPGAPLIYVLGTSMDSGKTSIACALIRDLTDRGLRVGGAKTTGVSLLRDTLAMRDHGAVLTLDFTDAGFPATGPKTAPLAARRIFSEMAHAKPDVIVVETGDGILGQYGVQEILDDTELRGWASAFVFCAQDPVGALGGVRLLAERWSIPVALVSGPVTDNAVGKTFIEETLGVPALNAFEEPGSIHEQVGRAILARLPATGSGNRA
ncbi:hypothetical protein B1B_10454, partial [mine drainage metagenome]